MGGGLGFLNKKPWHPGSLQNLERVAKREKEAYINKKKIDERCKKLKKERELEELVRLGMSSGIMTERDMSLDWMYKAGTDPNSAAECISKTNIPKSLDLNSSMLGNKTSSMEENVFPHSLVSNMSQNEMWHRKVNDPLVTMMQQEQIHRNSITTNNFLLLHLNAEKNVIANSEINLNITRPIDHNVKRVSEIKNKKTTHLKDFVSTQSEASIRELDKMKRNAQIHEANTKKRISMITKENEDTKIKTNESCLKNFVANNVILCQNITDRTESRSYQSEKMCSEN